MATGVNTSNLPAKLGLATLKGEVDKIHTGKIKTVPDVVKKIVHDKLITKVNVIDTSGFVLKTQYGTDKLGLEKKVKDADKKKKKKKTSWYQRIAKKFDYNVEISEIEGKTPGIAGLATTAAFTAVQNKITSVNHGHNHDHNIWRLFDILLNFALTTNETNMIITNKHSIYKLLRKLRLRNLGT